MPVNQITIAERGAAAEDDQTDTFSAKASGKKAGSKSTSLDTKPSGITKEVALKAIPKKKVKGNETNVWGEMEVLKGLDHPNIVSNLVFASNPPCFIVPLGQIL